MVSIAKKVSWEIAGPFVIFWMIPVEITKLKDFLLLFTGLRYHQGLGVIWQMMQPENLLRINTPEVQAVYDCINCSPQLKVEQTEMRRVGDEFLLHDQYITIKTNITAFFNYLGPYETAFYVVMMIARLLRLSPPDLVEELFYHYDDIWRNWVEWSDPNHQNSMHVVMPPMVSEDERCELRLEMYLDTDTRNQALLVTHDDLIREIEDYRDNASYHLIHNIKVELSKLQQVLDDHPM